MRMRTAACALGLLLGGLLAGQAQAALTVSLTAPAGNTVALAPASYSLSATAANPMGAPIKSVSFYAASTTPNGGTTSTLLGTVAAPSGPGAVSLPAQAAKAPIATSSTTSYTWNWTSVPMGIYTLTAVVTDRQGNTAVSSPVTVISDVPPSIAITRPANNSTAEPGDIPLAANAASPLGSIAKVDYYAAPITNGVAGTPSLIATSATGVGGTYTATWPNAQIGKYTLTAIATDNWGITSTSAPITLTLDEPRPYYIHTDQLDTPRTITDTQGNVVWQWDNADPYGNNPPNENPSNQGQFSFNLRFPGQYYDAETGLNYNRFRDYNPAIGGYLQSDLIGLRGGINTYAYAYGSPLRYGDPYGLYSLDDFSSDAANALTGLGDGASTVLGLGTYSTADIRSNWGIEGDTNQCSGAYKGGKYTGYAVGAYIVGRIAATSLLAARAAAAVDAEAAEMTNAAIRSEMRDKLADAEEISNMWERSQARLDAIAEALAEQGYSAKEIAKIMKGLVGF